MDQRTRFVERAAEGDLTHQALCRAFGISRRTGYKWIERFKENPNAPLVDRSHAPISPPHALSSEVIAAILRTKHEHPTWGPKKIVAYLRNGAAGLCLPATSTAGRLLNAYGLVKPRRSRQTRTPASFGTLSEIVAPNSTWCADFKGQFELRQDGLCYPLTISDGFSRYLLRCHGLSGTCEGPARKVFERCFREYGLPEVMRTDNGVPFSTGTLSGLSRLAVWWIRLGIKPERIAPGRPDQNGRHERMHRTLKEDVAIRPAATFSEQQLAFDEFRRKYNHDRPHEGLGDRTPGSLYQASSRSYPARLPELVYPDSYYLRRIGRHGDLAWLAHRVYISNCLAGEVVGLEERPSGLWAIHFGPLQLGLLDAQGNLLSAPQAHRRSQRRRGSDAL